MDSFGTHGTNCNLHVEENYIITHKFLVFLLGNWSMMLVETIITLGGVE